MHSVGFELSEFQICTNFVAKCARLLFLLNYNSSLWEHMVQCISQHNFMPHLDIDLEVEIASDVSPLGGPYHRGEGEGSGVSRIL